jgi:hypothetical protein
MEKTASERAQIAKTKWWWGLQRPSELKAVIKYYLYDA